MPAEFPYNGRIAEKMTNSLQLSLVFVKIQLGPLESLARPILADKWR
jgi:hypothetical protein